MSSYLDSWAELYKEDGSVDIDRLVTEADLLSVTTKPYDKRPLVEVEVLEYEVFLMVEGVEVRDTLEKENLMDVWNTTGTVTSQEESWIKGAIMLRWSYPKIILNSICSQEGGRKGVGAGRVAGISSHVQVARHSLL